MVDVVVGRDVEVVLAVGALVVVGRVVVVLLDVVVVGGAVVGVVVLVPMVTVALSLVADHVPRLSRTHSVTEYVPTAVYVWLTVGVPTVVEPPSPNCHHHAVTVPSGSDEPEPSSVIATFTVPIRSAPAFAVGAWSGCVVVVVDVDVVVDVEEVEELDDVVVEVDVEEVEELDDVVVGRDVEVLDELDDVVVGRDVDVLEELVDVVVDVDVVVLTGFAASAGRADATTRRNAAMPRTVLPLCRILRIGPLAA